MPTADHASSFVLGLDGGGSRSVAVLARRPAAAGGMPEIVGRGVGGPANPRVAGHGVARESLATAIAAAGTAAGIEPRGLAAACFGLAGVGLREDRDAVICWAEELGVAGRFVVVPDGLLPFADGAAEAWGVVLVAGTGSLALAVRPGVPLVHDVAFDRCGGWGPLVGDEGSGYAIGVAALRAVMRAADGRGPRTSLDDVVRRRFSAGGPGDLVARLHDGGAGRREVADIARDVLAAAAAADAVAMGIVAAAAVDLAAHVRTLAERNAFAAGRYPLRLTGGLLVGSDMLRSLVVDSLVAGGHAPGGVTVVTDAAAAAARFAASLV